ncbi:MAG: hypothetical protein ABII09_05640 [Planctomycetota bacterium]
MKAQTAKLVIVLVMCMPVCSAHAIDDIAARAFEGRDVHITADRLINFTGTEGQNVLVVERKFSLVAGADTFTGDRAVVWLRRETDDGEVVSVWAYISGKVFAGRGKGTRLPGLNWQMLESGNAMAVWFDARGEVFVTAQSRQTADVRDLELYGRAFDAVSKIDKNFAGVFEDVAPPPKPKPIPTPESPVEPTRAPAVERTRRLPEVFGFIERLLRPPRKPAALAEQARPQVKIRYPVNLAPAGDTEPNVEWGGLGKELEIATIIGRFYLWQKQDERGRLLEIQADAAVVFYESEKLRDDEGLGGVQDIGAKGAIKAIYVSGDVVMTDGLRTIRADEMYYDFVNKKGLAVNAVLRTFDVRRGIPIYLRAAKLKQLAEGRFAADNIVLTTSEFYTPQISIEASSVLVTDNTTIDQQEGQIRNSSYDVQMREVRLKAGKTTFLYWPFIRSNLERPDVPVKSMRVGNDSIWGTSVESRWYLSRLLGLQEPEGTDGTFELDYFSKRGVGAGVDVEYAQEDRLGSIIGYIIDDRGEDRLGREDFRRDLKPPEKLRGRFGWVHRVFVPYNWQVTMGINYESDENFVESYYRREFNTGPDRETYLHLKRIEDNWGLSLLGKGRLNDFADEMTEYPTGEYHLTGQSIFNDKLTLYSDTQGGQYRQWIGDYHSTAISEEPFIFATHRTEIDMPLRLGGVKAVPYVAGTLGYDDRSGFNRSLVDGSNAGEHNEDVVGIGEAGLRLSSDFSKVYHGVKSRLWDLDGLRHIVRPELAAAVYGESDVVVKQHDAVYLGLSQRLQTKRGPDGNKRTVDWMRLNLGATWVADAEQRSENSAPYRFIWNRPMTPLRMYTMPKILNGDLADGLKRFETYGPQRNYFSSDFSWQISDTTAFLSDAYYDVQEGTIEQLDFGFTRMRWPDLSYYIGSRYLRNVQVLDEHGSNAFVFAASYVLDPRYTLVFSQQFDFDYGANVESDITLIRRYHRVFWSLTFGADASLDRQAIVFSIWPQGVPEIAVGSRRYIGMTGPGEH